MGVWSTSSTRAMPCQPSRPAQPCSGEPACAEAGPPRALPAEQVPEVLVENVAHEGALAAAADARDAGQAPERDLDVEPVRLCRRAALTVRGGSSTRRARRSPVDHRVREGMLQETAGDRGAAAHDGRHRALGHDVAAVDPAAGAEVHDVLGPADGLLVVLHHDDRVALGAQRLQRVQEHEVVARVQADGRLVQDVADAAQVRAELGGQADALRLAAAQGGRRPVQREVGEPHALQEGEAGEDLGDDVPRDLSFPRRRGAAPSSPS